MASSKKKKSVKKSARSSAKKAKASKKSKPTKKAAPKKAAPKKAAQKRTTDSNSKKTKFSVHLTPIHDHVVVRQEGSSDRTPGGLYIPTMVQDKPQRGRVLAVGKGAINKKGKLRPLDVKVGETVLFGAYAGNKVTLEGEEVLLLKEEEILGVLS